MSYLYLSPLASKAMYSNIIRPLGLTLKSIISPILLSYMLSDPIPDLFLLLPTLPLNISAPLDVCQCLLYIL
jgi:hypothetical protein